MMYLTAPARAALQSLLQETSCDSAKDITEAYEHHANCYLIKVHDLDGFFQIIRWAAYFWLDIATPPPAAAEPVDPLAFTVGL